MPRKSLMKERKVLKKKFKAALKVLTKCANSFTPVTLLIESAQEQCFATSITMHCMIAGLRHVIWCLCLTFKRLFNILTFQLRFVCIFSCKIKVHPTWGFAKSRPTDQRSGGLDKKTGQKTVKNQDWAVGCGLWAAGPRACFLQISPFCDLITYFSGNLNFKPEKVTLLMQLLKLHS